MFTNNVIDLFYKGHLCGSSLCICVYTVYIKLQASTFSTAHNMENYTVPV